MSNDRRLSMPSGKLRLLAVDAGDVLDAGWVICLKYGTCTPSSFPFPPNIPCTMTQYLRSLVESILASTESGEDSFLFPLIDVLDKVLPPPPGHVTSSPLTLQSPSSLTTDPHLRWKCLLALDKVCATHDILPTRYPRINNLAVFGESPNKHGGSADVWRGEVNGRTVAVKVTRRYSTVPVSQAREVSLHLGSDFKSVFANIERNSNSTGKYSSGEDYHIRTSYLSSGLMQQSFPSLQCRCGCNMGT